MKPPSSGSLTLARATWTTEAPNKVSPPESGSEALRWIRPSTPESLSSRRLPAPTSTLIWRLRRLTSTILGESSTAAGVEYHGRPDYRSGSGTHHRSPAVPNSGREPDSDCGHSESDSGKLLAKNQRQRNRIRIARHRLGCTDALYDMAEGKACDSIDLTDRGITDPLRYGNRLSGWIKLILDNALRSDAASTYTGL